MVENDNIIKVNNPHDKLFRKIWSNLETARRFLQHNLPSDVAKLIDF